MGAPPLVLGLPWRYRLHRRWVGERFTWGVRRGAGVARTPELAVGSVRWSSGKRARAGEV